MVVNDLVFGNVYTDLNRWTKHQGVKH